MNVESANEKLRNEFGENITLEIKSYIEDDNTIMYVFTGVTIDESDAYNSVEECYENARKYLMFM